LNCPCGLDAVGVSFKDLGPQPIPLHPGSPQSLFTSVFQFSANLNRTKDWSWPSDAIPKTMTHWLVMGAQDNVTKPQMWAPEEKVADGWYNLRVSLEGLVSVQALLRRFWAVMSHIMCQVGRRRPSVYLVWQWHGAHELVPCVACNAAAKKQPSYFCLCCLISAAGDKHHF
jgi:hypothetical protein